jgi:hypothetical protein
LQMVSHHDGLVDLFDQQSASDLLAQGRGFCRRNDPLPGNASITP